MLFPDSLLFFKGQGNQVTSGDIFVPSDSRRKGMLWEASNITDEDVDPRGYLFFVIFFKRQGIQVTSGDTFIPSDSERKDSYGKLRI